MVNNIGKLYLWFISRQRKAGTEQLKTGEGTNIKIYIKVQFFPFISNEENKNHKNYAPPPLSHPAINLAMTLDPLIFDTRYSPPLPPPPAAQLVQHFLYILYANSAYCCTVATLLCQTPHSPSSLGAGLLWLVGTRARKSDIGIKQVRCTIHCSDLKVLKHGRGL